MQELDASRILALSLTQLLVEDALPHCLDQLIDDQLTWQVGERRNMRFHRSLRSFERCSTKSIVHGLLHVPVLVDSKSAGAAPCDSFGKPSHQRCSRLQTKLDAFR